MSLEEYSAIFGKLLGDTAKEMFTCLDSDKNGKVDAFEVFAVLILCSSTQANRKKKIIFGIFDLDDSRKLNEVEMTILLRSVLNGLGSSRFVSLSLLLKTEQLFKKPLLAYTVRPLRVSHHIFRC